MRRQQGLSLTELLIALVVGLFITSATFCAGNIIRQRRSTGQFNQLESARLALHVIERMLRKAGFLSFVGGRPVHLHQLVGSRSDHRH